MSQGDIEGFEGVAQAFEIIPAPVVGQDLLVPSDERLAGIELRTIGWQTVFVDLAFAQGVFDFHDFDFVRAHFGKRQMLIVAHWPSFARRKETLL